MTWEIKEIDDSSELSYMGFSHMLFVDGEPVAAIYEDDVSKVLELMNKSKESQ